MYDRQSADRNNKTATAAQRRVQADQAQTEQEQVKQLFEGIKRLQKEGKFEAASRQASELARRSPSNPAAVALQRQAAIAGEPEYALVGLAVRLFAARLYTTPKSLIFVPFRDLFDMAVWAGGIAGNTVEWRGIKYKLLRDGRLEPRRT